jgi:hypothetical protein
MRLERSLDKAFADTGSPVKSQAFPVGIDFLAATQPRPDLLFAPDSAPVTEEFKLPLRLFRHALLYAPSSPTKNKDYR